ncbi:SIS domain-containing protein [Paenibacillus nasutitermitis]|uniref:SIS domain-containing protein n=1 Tax=Paenibacillus nasutitermitis TaxID=1652958 RepID=A0A917DQJ9_9BACL|nr:SIS domain-containing protein [Paenibacillus nasutitermitis]GGD60160.1 hypothetical protein GCM10010911_17530 [Paenibacillus nasutitermitis]
MDRYFAKVEEIFTKVIESQVDAMKQAARACSEAMSANKKLFFFGTGHSHMLAEEVYYRAGGLMNVIPILETALMLHEGGPKSTRIERLEGYAPILLDEYKVGQDDVIFVISNSGLNAVPVEMALGAKLRGATVIALTNLQQSSQEQPRHSSGKKLFQAADIVLDNCGCIGDAAVHMDSLHVAVGPTSTVIGAFILNSIIVQAAQNEVDQGRRPSIFLSANLAKGDSYNAGLMDNLVSTSDTMEEV